MEKRWNILAADEEVVVGLSKSLNINLRLAEILVKRGIQTFDEAKNYFRPQIEQLHSPWLMKDMEKAVSRILVAFQRKENILVFGDYDVDGTTAVACMYQFLSELYPSSRYYIPHRYREGYGVSKQGIDYAKEHGVTLIISLDCGIKSVDLVAYAAELGIEFIICDHHLPDDNLPAAVAILNPKQVDCEYPYKELCGCGVGFKLMSALAERLNLPPESYLKYIDLVAIAIAADIVPMTGENRILTYYGLRKVNANPCPGIKSLMKLADAPKEMTIANLVFIIAPRVNAAGRMDDARKAVQLFIEQNENKATEFAHMLHNDNTERRGADSSMTIEALAMINESEVLRNRKSTVVYKPHWHKGVVGIVASRLIDTYYRPTVVLTRSGDIVAGSARSIAGFNLYEAIHACRDYLIGYGGHFAAAGMTMKPEHVEDFALRFEEEVCKSIQPQMLTPEIVVDAEIEFKDITGSFFRIINQMEPFGPENMRPVFVTRGVTDTGCSKIVKDNHVRCQFKQDNCTFSGIAFNLSGKFDLLQRRQPIDIAYTVDENTWNGNKSLQLKILDIKETVNSAQPSLRTAAAAHY